MANKGAVAGLIVMAFVALSIAACAERDTGTFSIDWQDKPLADALGTLKKHFGINYVLPAELGTLTVSANLWDSTPEEALKTVVNRAGLAAELRNATWFISTAEASDARGGGIFAQFPGMDLSGGMAGGGGLMGPNPAGGGGLAAPGPNQGFGTPPGRGGAATQQQASTQEEDRPMHFIVVPLFRASPETIGYAVDADDTIYDEAGGNGGNSGGYGGSSGGYGSSGGRGGSSSGYGNSGSSRGGSSRGGSSRGGSSRGGSSRGGSSRGGYN